MVLPKSCILSDSLLAVDPSSVSERVYVGIFGGSKVRVRRISFHPGGGPQEVKGVRPQFHVLSVPKHRANPQTFHQAVAVWKHLTHRNIVPLLGVTTDPLQLISVWMSDEDLTDYITNLPEADRQSLVGVPPVALFDKLTPSLAI